MPPQAVTRQPADSKPSRARRRDPGQGAWSPKVRAHLRHIFGLTHLRSGQEEVIRHILDGHDTLALMATGAGKSLCYQLPATLLPGRTLVISPLIALMKDQCDKLREMGISAVQLNSGQLAVEREKSEDAIRSGEAKVIMTTPEQLTHPAFIQDVSQHDVSLLVVDEAHCISEWGHDFRPAFLEIGTALKRLGRPVVLALTATATEAAIEDVMQQLDLPDMHVVNTGLYRPNLHYAVDHVGNEESKNARLLTLLKHHEGQGIVYTSTVKAAQQVLELIVQAGETATLYHGHMAAGQRRESQDAYMRGSARIMVATQAFGMGIDKTDTRFVIHYQMPSGLETYYQESGRAGRDGEAAHCTLLYLPKDRAIQQFFLTGRYPTSEDLQAVYQKLLAPPDDVHAWAPQALIGALDRPGTKVQLALHLLRKQGVVRSDAKGLLHLKQTQLDASQLAALLEGYAQRRQRDRDMLETMVFYCQSGLCRWKMLLQHFDQAEDFERCGHCDNCVRMQRAEAEVRAENATREARAQAAQEAADAPGPARTVAVGDAVRVPRYGRGRVVSIDDVGVTVDFPNGPQRSFLPQYVSRIPARRSRD